MDEAVDRTARAVAFLEDNGGGPRAGELRTIQRIREERDRVGSGARERTDARYDSLTVAVQLATEGVRELAQGRGHVGNCQSDRPKAGHRPPSVRVFSTSSVMSTVLLK